MAADIKVENHGSLVLVDPLTDEARSWLAGNVQEDAQWWNSALAVEPRYLEDILHGLRDEGFTIEGEDDYPEEGYWA